MKFKNYDELKDNFIDFEKSSLVFNIYKTAGKYNKQTFVIPKELVDIIKNYSNNSKNDYLFNDANGNKCGTYTLNSYINKIFNNNIGINGCRHSFISEKVLPFLPKLKELEYYARFMGHSISTQLTYKKDFN
jgi:integrase